MAFQLDSIVPWGRSFAEYARMFALGERELAARILGCGDGPASFNAGMRRQGRRVVSIDPLYAFSVDEIRRRIDETFDRVVEQTRLHPQNYLWDEIPSVERLAEVRKAAMDDFLADYPGGGWEGRYVAGALPWLPFGADAFDIVLSSHFLFLYSGHLSEGFHHRSITAMLRVAPEARVFPLLTLDSRPSPYVAPVADALRSDGFAVEIRKVRYEFQLGGNEMMVVRRRRKAGSAASATC